MLTLIDSLSNDGQLFIVLVAEILRIKEKLENNTPNRLYFRLVVGSEKYGARFYVGVEQHYKIKSYWSERDGTSNNSLGYIYTKNLTTLKVEKFIETIVEKLVKDYGYTV